MGGGVAWRAAAKAAGVGVLNGSLRGGEKPFVSAARRSSRSVASVVSSSDDVKLAFANNNNNKMISSVEKPYEDCEFAGLDVLFREAGEPMPRMVFGGPLTIQEAGRATYDLIDALEKTYLSPIATIGQKSFVLLDPEHVEAKLCIDSETPASNHAVRAFRLLRDNPEVRNTVVSLASDPNVWKAVHENKEFRDFLLAHETDDPFVDSLQASDDEDPNVDDPSVEIPQASESKSASGKGFMGYLEDIKQKVFATAGGIKQIVTVPVVGIKQKVFQTTVGITKKVTARVGGVKPKAIAIAVYIKHKITVSVVDMVDSFQYLFGGSAKCNTTSAVPSPLIIEEKTATENSLWALAMMVIFVAVLKRV